MSSEQTLYRGSFATAVSHFLFMVFACQGALRMVAQTAAPCAVSFPTVSTTDSSRNCSHEFLAVSIFLWAMAGGIDVFW